MYNRSDPRFRRRLNQLSHNLESANESAQVGLFSFSQHYLKPCLSSISRCFEPCTGWCFPNAEDQRKRQRKKAKARGRPEYSFDFYDDWEDDESDALLALGDDEFDRVVGGNEVGKAPVAKVQPGKQSVMAYGARDGGGKGYTQPRKRSIGRAYDPTTDPTIIPSQSRFGFLTKLPFNIGGKGKGLRYKPSAADLQERPRFHDNEEGDTLMAHQDNIFEEDEHAEASTRRSKWPEGSRQRSATANSGHTTDSYSSRGDIFPSDDEDDAVPLDDEFAMVLDRRATFDETSSGQSRGTRPGVATRNSTQSGLSQSSKKRRSRKSSISKPGSQGSDRGLVVFKEDFKAETKTGQSMEELKEEEQRVQAQEEEEVEKRRIRAMRLAREKGFELGDGNAQQQVATLNRSETPTSLSRPPSSQIDMSVPSRQFPHEAGSGFPFPAVEMRSTPRSSKTTSARSSVSGGSLIDSSLVATKDNGDDKDLQEHSENPA